MTHKKGVFVLAMLLSGIAAPARAIELQTRTLDAWREYVRGADGQMQGRRDTSFLWIEESEDRLQRVRRGETVVAPLASHGTLSVANGLIHHWIGAVFIPNTTIDRLLTVAHNHDKYRDIYKPVVTDSKALASTGTEQEFSMTWQRQVLFVNAAMQGWYRAHDCMIDSRRGYSIADATRIQQIQDYRRPSEHLLPPDTGDGFMWRIHSITRFEERDGGVYLEIEALALTRDIPASLRWLVTPVVNHLAANSLTTTLSQTRQAVRTQGVTVAERNLKGQN